jgi:5-methylcytosine-specific restriction endonuclease McrA
VQWTLGILRHFQAFFYTGSFFCLDGVPPPTPAPLTQTVGQVRSGKINMSNNEWQEWQKNKLRQQEVQKWISLFMKADSNQEEWQKIYRAYLQSDIWKQKRNQVLKRADGKCERCKAIIFDPDVHHLTYDRVGGNERLDDLIVLCFPCHRNADDERDMETDEQRTTAYYDARLYGFATRKYGEAWWYDHERRDVEIEFIMFLYKKYCQEYELDFDPHLDPEADFDFIEFWNRVRNGYE